MAKGRNLYGGLKNKHMRKLILHLLPLLALFVTVYSYYHVTNSYVWVVFLIVCVTYTYELIKVYYRSRLELYIFAAICLAVIVFFLSWLEYCINLICGV